MLTESGMTEVGGKMSHYRDDSGKLSFSEIQNVEFTPLSNPNKAPSYGFDPHVHWFRFSLTNDSNIKDWRMEIPYAPLDQIDFYLEPDPGSVWMHKVDGDIYPLSQRDLPHRHTIFNFTIDPHRTKTVYIKVTTISSVQVPIIFWSIEAFQIASYKTQLINGLFYGAMFIMAMYQLFLFLSIRDKSTFYYVLTLVSMANVIAFFQGYTFMFLHPNQPSLNDDWAALTGPFFVLCSALLTRSFLSVRQFSKTLDNLLVGNTVITLTAGILMVFFIRQISYKYLHIFTLIHCVIVLVAAAYCLSKKYKPALYYLLAWATLLLAAVVFTMGNLGLAPGYLGTNYQGLMIGCVLQVLLIALALGERWNVLVKENEKAKELELRRGQEENERLEREVRQRTLEIQKQKEKLEELNRVKDKLFSVVSHDIKGPLSSLKLSLALTKISKLSSDEFKTISIEIEDHLDKTTNFIENLLHWAKLQLKAETMNPTQLDLPVMIDETLELLDAEIKQKVISVNKKVQPNFYAYADHMMIQSVLKNLITNAVKFTPVGGSLQIVGKTEADQAIISVTDTGSGIPPVHRERIFTLESVTTPGTKDEAGTGLGLFLCKEFVERNNGKIWYESVEGKGTTFYFSLPEYKEEFKFAE
ncbi:MAG TPA: sensor histidine kinase [Cyclobacteriaceae bacterium]|nr:sensor histidine kinase [Cyclobacteriaceae bacterium]